MRRLQMLLSSALLAGALAGGSAGYAQTDTTGVEFLPGGTLFPPLAANPQEPRVGVRKEIGTSRLKLDIGSAIDFLQWTLNREGTQHLRVGADFFTYALTTSAEGLRLQVDAVDGFFGGHIVYRNECGDTRMVLRLRLLHLSAHLIDGHYDNAAGMWKNNQLPLPFTRDFGELTAAVTLPVARMPLMFYSGIAYSTLVRPDDLKNLGSLHGIEFRTGDRLGTLFGKPFAAYCAWNLTLTGIPTYIGTNVAEVGIKCGAWDGQGIRFYVNHLAGLEPFSQYYNVRTTRWGTGFAFDFW